MSGWSRAGTVALAKVDATVEDSYGLQRRAVGLKEHASVLYSLPMEPVLDKSLSMAGRLGLRMGDRRHLLLL